MKTYKQWSKVVPGDIVKFLDIRQPLTVLSIESTVGGNDIGIFGGVNVEVEGFQQKLWFLDSEEVEIIK